VIKLLLVEDNEINADMMARRLKRKFEVIVAATGLEALDKAQSERPDVILMDLGLPDIDGLEATRRLKADATTQRIPIIALTAQAMAGDREKTLAAGCDDYETKPIDLPRLTTKIQSLVARSAPDAPAASPPDPPASTE
jgi:CheY-like chemotaxis protein